MRSCCKSLLIFAKSLILGYSELSEYGNDAEMTVSDVYYQPEKRIYLQRGCRELRRTLKKEKRTYGKRKQESESGDGKTPRLRMGTARIRKTAIAINSLSADSTTIMNPAENAVIGRGKRTAGSVIEKSQFL